MNHNCKCGGKITTLDWQWNQAGTMMNPTELSKKEPGVAHFVCASCGRQYKQRKRTAGTIIRLEWKVPVKYYNKLRTVARQWYCVSVEEYLKTLIEAKIGKLEE